MTDVPTEVKQPEDHKPADDDVTVKTAKTGQTYSVSKKTFVWTTDEGATVRIPMRIKLGLLRSIGDKEVDDVGTRFEMIDLLAPGQADVMDEQDVNDFQAMFSTWQEEYNLLNLAALGESEGSSSSSTSTEQPSNMTGEPVSA
jgi:hypothetical protein